MSSVVLIRDLPAGIVLSIYSALTVLDMRGFVSRLRMTIGFMN
ncbi:MAG TPA: hypothetical protein VE422_47370 [Terriglobia bacterium]|nr:hypothetical protein [Terriglobia bacterium]